MLLGAMTAQAQINIAGNVYGGGNAGNLGGKTEVTIYGGDIHQVYGGARQANVSGSTFVHIDGEHASNYVVIDKLFGGNDIAGTIGSSDEVPSELTEVGTTAGKNNIDNTWNTFVRTSTKTETTGEGDNAVTTEAAGAQKIYIGQLFGGGNGDYDYTSTDSPYKGMTRPELGKAYLEILGGSIVYAYGGGNNATITDRTVIDLNNPSEVVSSIIDASNPNANTDSEKGDVGELLTNARFEDKMGINTSFSYPSSDAFQIGRLFGGNNKADMAIRPRWNLQKGRVRNLYGGGNEGRMTSPEGLLLQIEGAGMVVDNVYGGCRKADVIPLRSDGTPMPYSQVQLDPADNPNHIPAGYAARVRVLGGHVNNVYGGNDISGNVYAGNTVGIMAHVYGDVYGGGNGSYAYTDNVELKDDPRWRDLYYNPDEVLEAAGITGVSEELKSVTALNLIRPNAEKVSILVRGEKDNPTMVDGSFYVGGNSASLRENVAGSSSGDQTHIKIGSYVIIDKVFLGNNGENMIKTDEADAEGRGEGVLRTLKKQLKEIDAEKYAGNTEPFNSMDLTDEEVFAKYMEGCAMKVKSTVVFESRSNGDGVDYIPYTTQFGSFYCGGNVGSMIAEGKTTVNFSDNVIIFDKVVGGCNNSFVTPRPGFNAIYEGGITGDPDPAPTGSPEGTIGDKLQLNFTGLKIRPKRWVIQRDANYVPVLDANGKEQYILDSKGNRQLEWNTISVETGEDVAPITSDGSQGSSITSSDADLDRRLKGGNIYGGCYDSGIVNGNVIINIDNTLMEPDELFDKVENDGSLYGHDILTQESYTITERRTGVILGQQGMDVLGTALNIYGGGKGNQTEIWGSTTINHNGGYVFQIFGGSEEGVIGKGVTYTGTPKADKTYENGVYYFKGKKYTYNANYSCTVNLKGQYDGVPKNATANSEMSDCEFIYGGGFLGPICGNTIVNLGKGRIFNSFTGSCNADILGHTETYMGRQINNGTEGEGFPYVRDYIYGGNDMGGRILGTADFSSRVSTTASTKLYHADMPKNVSSYVEYIQGHAIGIFGGCFGTYDYKDPEYREFFTDAGVAKDGYTKPRMDKVFVNFRPTSTAALKSKDINTVTEIYGAGQGYPGDADRDIMQQSSYILIDIPQDMTNFRNMEVWGAGAWSGLGMRTYVAPDADDEDRDAVSAVIDLARGTIGSVYGGSYREGFTRRSVVNVPDGSTMRLNKLFGGAYGDNNTQICDVYEANVNYHSADATVSALYGGNNSYRRTLYGRMNITVPVWSDKQSETLANIYGAGFGENTWSQYTEVNLLEGAQVSYVYGGGENGRVLNVPTALKQAETEFGDTEHTGLKIAPSYGKDKDNNDIEYTDNGLANSLAKARHDGNKYNTNVIIHRGAQVGLGVGYKEGDTRPYARYGGYAFGGGMGTATIEHSGDVNGTTYIALLGGIVWKDLYAAGRVGAVLDNYGNLNDDLGQPFKAGTTAFIAGGTARNVYGGGYMGSVGKHIGEIDDNTHITEDIEGDTHVIIGIRKDQSEENLTAALTYVKGSEATLADYGFYNGVPAIQRNAYGGGEGEEGKGGRGGAVYGTAHLTLNNGCIGYEYDGETVTQYAPQGYREKLNDETWLQSDSTGRLKDYGNIFGGGYSDKSNVDYTDIVVYGGIVRGSVHGGAEIAAIGRGATQESGQANATREFKAIYKPGKTHVEMYNGHVLHNVFGGGKGYNVLGFGGANNLYTDGYVFGQTEVYIHGGVIGTKEGIADGYGNVFGGGDVGFIYSKGYTYTNSKSPKTPTGSPGHYYYYYNDGTGDHLIEDCKVVVSPYLQVKPGQEISWQGDTYNAYDYVPTEFLNTLPKKSTVTDGEGHTTKQFTGDWLKLFTGVNSGVEGATEDTEERGVNIHNAVFAGGNVSSNSDKTYANQTTVFGNTTATLYDVYHRDFITVGTEHIGGIYGGGNLSVVDGYRELNISNYGTDYYGLDSQITLDEYKSLSNRERAYFQLQYICNAEVSFDGVTYEENKVLKEDEYLKLLERHSEAKAYFTPYGFCSIYAGRLLNTIQRADFCGVYGSRMVLQGAKDRVAEVGEDIDYTINRVGELSLNLQHSVAGDSGDDASHGNYFGIYSVVNYMGNLTSDVRFGEKYVNGSGVTDDDQTYYSYKAAAPTSSTRNKGQSANQVALASGVFLELTTENSTAEHKDYGYVTGVIELDLINVKRDEVGGGFVYAKNEHRVPMYYPNKSNVILSEYNTPKSVNGVKLRDEARTYKRYRYSTDQEGDWSEEEGATVVSGDDAHLYETMFWQTSGNFIHPSKRIVDDCYPINNAYKLNEEPYSEAHYWYIKGDVYIYDQKVSAYTGSANAYSKEVHLPLTITAASHGRLQLLNVKPNLYAYYAPTDDTGTEKAKIGTFKDGNNEDVDKVWVNNNADSYELNDVITWWDWHQLSATERSYFVTQTYVNCITCTIDGEEYEAGTYVMDDTDFTTFKETSHSITNTAGEATTVDFVFRQSNNIGHDTGYVLTFDMNTPKPWDDHYTLITSSPADTIYKAKYNGLSASDKLLYREGPTFTPQTTGVYGQRQYDVGDIITKGTHDNHSPGEGDQAIMEVAYVSTQSVSYTYNGLSKTANAGTPIPESEYNAIGSTAQAAFGQASICTSTVKLSSEKYLLYGELLTEDQMQELKDIYASVKDNDDHITGYTALADEIDLAMTPAYICSQAGGYGGRRLVEGTNYDAISTWCSLSRDDRIDANGDKFTFNYDALDLLTDADYLALPGVESPNHERTVQAFHSPYTDQVPVEYSAVFAQETSKTVEFTDGTASKTFNPNDPDADKRLTNEQFENVRNDQRHYTRISVKSGGEDIYFATENFIYNGIPYGKGQVVDEDVAKISVNQGHVEKVTFTNTTSAPIIKFYCYEGYGSVSKGHIIDDTEYIALTNHQKYFVIQGQEPTETTTLYVSRESDIYDLTTEKVITVVYRYTYYEDEDDGSVKLTNELHVVNIHLALESGVPQIGQLNPPSTVLPGSGVGLKAPEVKPGLYEILTSGWELFNNYEDAIKHQEGMGVPFTNNSTPVYWYQHKKAYVAFYSKTYLGKTYSNPVPLNVANYHDLKEVLADPTHLHIDYNPALLLRDCKVYVNDYSDDTSGSANGLELLSDLVDLSYGKSDAVTAYGAFTTPSNIAGGDNLDIILRTDLSAPTAPGGSPAWTPIANGTGECFGGTLHGDGHHVSGIDNSLFGHLCGNVYNLGVTGSFTSAGIADTGTGYVENCWVKSTETSGFTPGVNPVFGNPTRAGTDGIQVVNCYYPVSNAYSLSTDATVNAHGVATQMPDRAFYNGEVTYDLNGFYLNKRYYEGSQQTEPVTSDRPELTSGSSYVVNRYADGDFIYANGTIPLENDIRLHSETTGTGDNVVTTYYYAPIWPDDYIYFGQMLTYGWNSQHPHDDVPSCIVKFNGRLTSSDESNRVYRAPAYYQSKKMEVAHFNPNVNLVAYSMPKDANDKDLKAAYPNMTAIDFYGHNDTQWSRGSTSPTVMDKFYQPLLDESGLNSIINRDETPNLLVYAPTEEANAQTYGVLTDYFTEPEYNDYYVENDDYRRVAAAPTSQVFGHLVHQVGDKLKATSDHLLVDKRDFNCPIGYSFASGKRMWYQRVPDHYISLTQGWSTVSLPFTAELVSTQDKGEITHFYSGSPSVDGSTKTGHEYWLSEYNGQKANTNPQTDGFFTAVFNYPTTGVIEDKKVGNTFLWDYYYSKNVQKDAHADIYQTRYQNERTMTGYPLLATATPYMIGFPGKTFYEFDLSGEWKVQHTATTAPAQLGKQTISFVSKASEPGNEITIGVSDDEISEYAKTSAIAGYKFMPNYMSKPTTGYLMNLDGNSFVETPTGGAAATPFRPYFEAESSNQTKPRYILFASINSPFDFGDDEDPSGNFGDGDLVFTLHHHTIRVTSSLKNEADVHIYNVSGVVIANFTIQPGETVDTNTTAAGVYIIRAAKGRILKKIAIR